MIRYIIKRMITVFVVLWMVATLTYFTVHVTPGDTATAILYSVGGESAVNSENLEHIRSKYDLDRPVYEQYFEWVVNAFKGELGTSYKYNKPVSYMLKLRLPNTLRLGLSAVALSVIVSIPFGIASALHHNRLLDHAGRVFTLLISSFPSFWVAIVLIIVCGLKLKLLPVGGMQGPESIILPAVTLSMGMTAATTRMMRSSMLDVVGQDYILAAKAKGMKPRKILTRHIFSWPGVGGLLMDAINAKDTPMIEGCVLLIAFGYTMIHLFVDILYACLDPKLKYSGEDS